MTLAIYGIIVVVLFLLYLICISLHSEVKSSFDSIKKEIDNAKAHIGNAQGLYPFFLAQRRATNAHWIINGCFSFSTLATLFLSFFFTIPEIVEKKKTLSDSIDVIADLGLFAVVQPIFMGFAVLLLFSYWVELRAFEKWHQ